MKKEIVIVSLAVALVASMGFNGYLYVLNTDLCDSLKTSISNTEIAVDAAYANGHLMNDTLWYYRDLRESVDELSMLNIAWSMYVATGNVSWLPQSPSEFENVTDEYGTD
jgi:hypothetical protein